MNNKIVQALQIQRNLNDADTVISDKIRAIEAWLQANISIRVQVDFNQPNQPNLAFMKHDGVFCLAIVDGDRVTKLLSASRYLRCAALITGAINALIERIPQDLSAAMGVRHDAILLADQILAKIWIGDK